MEATMTLTGYVGHDIELKTTRTGVPTITFRVATTPRIRTDTGWIDGTTTWMTVTCYRALAEHATRSLTKGDAVIVHGRVRTQMWDDAGGGHHERLVIEASAIGHDLNRGVTAFARAAARSDIGYGSVTAESVEAAESDELDEETVEVVLAGEAVFTGTTDDVALAA